MSTNLFNEQFGKSENLINAEDLMSPEIVDNHLIAMQDFNDNSTSIHHAIDNIAEKSQNPLMVEEAVISSDNMDIIGMERLMKMRLFKRESTYSTEALHPAIFVGIGVVLTLIIGAVIKYMKWMGGATEEVAGKTSETLEASAEKAEKWGKHQKSLLDAMDVNTDSDKKNQWLDAMRTRITSIERGTDTPAHKAIVEGKYTLDSIGAAYKTIHKSTKNLIDIIKPLDDLVENAKKSVDSFLHNKNEARLNDVHTAYKTFIHDNHRVIAELLTDSHTYDIQKHILGSTDNHALVGEDVSSTKDEFVSRKNVLHQAWVTITTNGGKVIDFDSLANMSINIADADEFEKLGADLRDDTESVTRYLDKLEHVISGFSKDVVDGELVTKVNAVGKVLTDSFNMFKSINDLLMQRMNINTKLNEILIVCHNKHVNAVEVKDLLSEAASKNIRL